MKMAIPFFGGGGGRRVSEEVEILGESFKLSTTKDSQKRYICSFPIP